jgi:hypothetical protein
MRTPHFRWLVSCLGRWRRTTILFHATTVLFSDESFGLYFLFTFSKQKLNCAAGIPFDCMYLCTPSPFSFFDFNGGGLGLCSVRSVYTLFGCIFSLLHVLAFFTTTIATGQLLPPLNQKRSHCRKTCCHITTEQMSIRYDYDTKFNDTPQTFASPRVRCDRCLHPDITAHVVLAGPWLRHRLHAGTLLAIPKRFNTQLCKFAAGTYQATSDDLLTVDGKVAQQIEWTEGKKASVASNHICDLNSRSYDPRCCF